MPIRETEKSPSLLLYLFLNNQITEKEFKKAHYSDPQPIQLQRVAVIRKIVFKNTKCPLQLEDPYYREIQYAKLTEDQYTALQSIIEKYASGLLLELGESFNNLERNPL